MFDVKSGSADTAIHRHNEAVYQRRRVRAKPNRRRDLLWQISLTYDSNHHVTLAKDSAGRSVHYSYTGGQLTKMWDLNGQPTTFTWFNSVDLGTITDANGHKTTIGYSPFTPLSPPNVFSSLTPPPPSSCSSNCPSYSIGYTTNSNGKITAVDITDPRGIPAPSGVQLRGLPDPAPRAIRDRDDARE